MEEYLELFISETESYIKQMNDQLLILEGNNRNKDSILEVFRILHTIKGMAQTMGFEEIATVSHKAEDLLGDAKSKGEINPRVLSFLFTVADYIANAVQMIKEKNPLPDPQQIVQVLEELARGKEIEFSGQGITTREISEIRIKTEKLDKLFNLTNELLITRSRLLMVSQKIGDSEMVDVCETAGRLISALQDEVMRLRMLPVSTVFDFFPRWVRDEAKRQNKEVDFVISGGELEVDRSIIDVLKEPIMHLLRNALDHGIEKKGRITLAAQKEKEFVRISVSDDGRGIDPEEIREKAIEKKIVEPMVAQRLTKDELYRLLLRPDFSTKKETTEISGRGIGLDIVYSTVTELGGRVEIASEKGKGSIFTIELPLSLAVQRAMVFALDGQRFAIPLNYITESFYIEESEIKTVYGRELIALRDDILPLVRPGNRLNCVSRPGRKSVIVVRYRNTQRGFVVDEIIAEDELVVKKIDPLLPGSLYAGCAIYADGKPILILEPRGFE
ncbi:MAG: chemotaxis protein CheA [candidate division WOR-3 bacterium]